MLKKMVFSFVGALLLALPVYSSDNLNGAGASFPYPVYSAWAYLYHKAEGVRVNYQSIGSGGGVRQISDRTVHFGASDAPLTPEKQAEKKLLQFPAVIGGVVPVVNIQGVKSGEIQLTSQQLAQIFLGEIKKWNHPSLRSSNPESNLPDKEITVVHRSDGSGTTAIFTTYLEKVSRDWRSKVGKGKSVKWPVGIGGKGNEGVANYVKRVKNSIGYVEFAYAKNSRLSYVRLQNQSGKFVSPSFEAFEAAAAFAQWDQKSGYYLWLVDAPGTGSWPIAGATFILLAKEKTEVNRRVVRFFDWTFNNGDPMAKKLVYVPLPLTLKKDIRDYWRSKGLY